MSMALFEKYPVLLDGATGTELQKRGMPPGSCPELWVLEHPDAIISLQRDYVSAGSQIVYAPTFGANAPTLRKNGCDGSVADINRQLVSLSREAAGGNALVGGDIAPTGLLPAPYGETSLGELLDIYTEQAEALESAGVDLFVIETSMSLCEARAALLAVKAVSDKPALVSFTVGNGGRAIYGSSLLSALVTAQAIGADAFGVNCCGDLPLLENLIKKLRELSRIPLIAKPNAGLPVTESGRAVYPLTPLQFAEYSVKLAEAGASFIGGCCGTTSEHIRLAKKALEGVTPPAPEFPEDAAFCASDTAVLRLTGDTVICDITCSEDLPDDADEAAENGAELIRLTIPDRNALSAFLESASMLPLPLCLRAEDEEVLEQAVKNYSGVAFCDMPRSAFTEKLSRKYGLKLI